MWNIFVVFSADYLKSNRQLSTDVGQLTDLAIFVFHVLGKFSEFKNYCLLFFAKLEQILRY